VGTPRRPPSTTAISPRATSLLARALVLAQLTAIVCFGVLSVDHFFIFGAGGDERAHFSYIQTIAQQGRLPIVNRDYVSAPVEAMSDGLYPLSSPVSPASIGLRGRSYEAFQPPLYYLTAVPIFELSSNYVVKLKLLRGYGLALLLLSIGLCALIARRAFGAGWLLPFSFVLTVYLWPGVLVNGTTVTNGALEMPLMIATVWALWRAEETRAPRLLVGAGVLVGLCLLTQVTLVFVVPLLVVVAGRFAWRLRTRRALAVAATALVLPLAMLSPWFAFNESHYHALTADSLAEKVQSAIGPGGHVALGFVTSGDVKMVDGLLPEDWWFEGTRTIPHAIEWLVVLELLGFAAAAVAVAWRRHRRAVPWLLILPAPLWLLTMDVATVVAKWNLLHPRYGYPTLPLLALFAAGTLARSRGGARAVLLASGATSALLVGTWIWLAATFYF
jgi:4-amino-4-deoxy-L-arabinose transferase-like glycosyltransferase